MTALDFSIIFSFGLLSSLHCIQMCGPIVLSYSLPLQDRAGFKLLPAHLAYNAGRIITYSALGAVAGLAGQSLGVAGQLAGIENFTAIIAGILMLLAGLFMLDLIPFEQLRHFDLLRITSGFLKPLGNQISSPSPRSKFILGLMLGFLPCGLIYAALLKAMATGTAFSGAITMTAFGTGTSGALLMIGVFSGIITRRLSQLGSRLAAVSVVLLGLLMIIRGIMPMIMMTASGEAASACHQ
ncbi:MAG: sulfite exporter TauE/SafE family protein [Acidobacteria bacterium]|nr:sulfite exporter TauE/SafE family protein [Acidobacteriota bacterium]